MWLFRKYSLAAGALFILLASWACARVAIAGDCVKPEWKVESVRLPNDPRRAPDSYVQLGDVIAIKSSNLADLRKCATPNNPVLLYLDRMPLKGLLEYPPSNPASNEASYKLEINSDNRRIWSTLLGSPTLGTIREVEVSLGLADGFGISSEAKKIGLRPLPPKGFAVWAVLFVGGLIAFFRLARKSSLIRGGTPAGGQTFSIARSQAAWWFFLILAAYLLIGLTTGDYTTTINSTALTLLGIASATYVASAAVDTSKMTPEELAAQNQEKTRLESIPAEKRTSAQKDKLSKLSGESQGWLKDVLSDFDGIDFHRFQMLVWTTVLGIVFITRVWTQLAMPDFDSTLLGLTGLSAMTYIGLKIPETTK